jgi:hypothetical protein
MARILAFPFRLAPNGSVATVEQETDQADREQIAVLALTRRGERPLVPGFGILDPAFGGFDPGALSAAVAVYGPPRTITDVTVVADTETSQVVEVAFA